MWIVKNILHNACFCDATVLQNRHAAAGVLDRIQFMRDHQNGDASGAVDLAQQIEYLQGRLRIQCGGGLIADEQIRFADQRAGDADTLFLAAGQATWIGVSLSVRPTSSAVSCTRCWISFFFTPAISSG